MINMTALAELLASQGITPRIERPDYLAELTRMTHPGRFENWNPKPRRGEQTLAIGHDEVGAPVAIFIPH